MAFSPSIKKQDKIIVKDDQVCCNGSVVVGANHPAVYLSLKKHKEIECPYCGAIYQKTA